MINNIKPKLPFCVHIVEYERSWGNKVDEILDFSTYAEAETYVKEYNDKHNPPLLLNAVPDWCMVAQDPYTRKT
jgi:hypothetical protein